MNQRSRTIKYTVLLCTMFQKTINQSKPTLRTLLINTGCLAVSSWGLFHATRITLPPSLKDAGHKQFLTNISVVLTIINNLCNIVNWFFQRCDLNVNLLEFFNFISRDITLPVALVMESIVPVVYWPLRLFALKLIMQGIGSSKSPIPISVDLSIHLFPSIFLLGDHYLSGSGLKFKISNVKAWFIVTILGIGYYQYLSLLIDPTSGQHYPYPFLDVDEPYKSVIFVLVTSITWCFYTFYQNFPPSFKAIAANEIKKQI